MGKIRVNDRSKREGDVPWLRSTDALARGARFKASDVEDIGTSDERARPISLLTNKNAERIEMQIEEFAATIEKEGISLERSSEISPFIYGEKFSENSLRGVHLPPRFSITKEVQKGAPKHIKRGDCHISMQTHLRMYGEAKEAFLSELKKIEGVEPDIHQLELSASKKMSLVSSAIQTFSSFALNQRFGDGRNKSEAIDGEIQKEYVSKIQLALKNMGIRSWTEAENIVLPKMSMEYGKGVGGTFYCPKSLPAHLSVATMLSGIAGLKIYSKNLSFKDFEDRWRFKDFGPFCSTPGSRLQAHGKLAPYGFIDPDRVVQMGSISYCIARKRTISASSKVCHAMNRVAAKTIFLAQKAMPWWVENTNTMESRANALLKGGWVPFSSDFSQFDKSQNASLILSVMDQLLPAWQYELFLAEFYAPWIAPSVHPEYDGRIIESDPSDPASGFLNTGQSFTTVCNINTAVLVMASAIKKIFGYSLKDVGKKWHMFNLGDDIVLWLKPTDATNVDKAFDVLKGYGFEISVDPGFIFLMKTLTKKGKLTNLMARSLTSFFEPEAQRPNALVNTLMIAGHSEALRYHPMKDWYDKYVSENILRRLPLALYDTVAECERYVNSEECVKDVNAYAASSIEARLAIEKIVLGFSSGVGEELSFESAGLKALYGMLDTLPRMAVSVTSLDNKSILRLFEDHQTWLDGGALSPDYSRLVKNAEAALKASGGQGVINILS
jgi:hypothetical protein